MTFGTTWGHNKRQQDGVQPPTPTSACRWACTVFYVASALNPNPASLPSMAPARPDPAPRAWAWPGHHLVHPARVGASRRRHQATDPLQRRHQPRACDGPDLVVRLKAAPVARPRVASQGTTRRGRQQRAPTPPAGARHGLLGTRPGRTLFPLPRPAPHPPPPAFSHPLFTAPSSPSPLPAPPIRLLPSSPAPRVVSTT
jgi:hypothetical protein